MRIEFLLLAMVALPQIGVCACLTLARDQTLYASVSPEAPACFLVAVEAGQATQIAVDQPEDLEIQWSEGARKKRSDGFQFGTETATIDSPGEYRITVALVPAAGSPGTLTFGIARRPVLLSQAEERQMAEDWATRSKTSDKMDDIAESLRRWTALGERSAVARTQLKVVHVLLRTDPAAAWEADKTALSLCQEISDLRCEAEVANNRGSAARRLGRLDESREWFGVAASEFERLGDRLDQGVVLSNLGLLYQQAGDLQSATRTFDQARTILQNLHQLAYARATNNLGLCYLQSGDYDKARAHIEAALAGFVRTNSPRDAAIARLNLGRIAMLTGHLPLAQQVLEQALADVPEGDRSARADTLDNLGQVYRKRHLAGQAETSLREALALHKALSDKRGQGYDFFYLGELAQERGDFPSARDLLTQSFQIRSASGLRDNTAESLINLADLEFLAGDLSKAGDLAEQALKLQESIRSQVPPALRASYYANKQEVFDLLVDIAMAPGTPAAAAAGLLAAERGRGRALLDLLAEGSLIRRVEPQQFESRAKAQQRISFLSASLAGATGPRLASLRQALELAVADDEAVERRITDSVADLPLGKPLDSVERLQREFLPSAGALLEYRLGVRHSYLWLVEHDRVRVFPLPPREQVETQVAVMADLFCRILDRRREPQKEVEFQSDVAKLSATLLGPLKGIVLPARLVLVLDGALYRVPFAALPWGGSHEPLGLSHDLVQSPAASYLISGRKPRPVNEFSRAILALVDPVFGASDDRVLPGAAKRAANSVLEMARLPFTDEVDTIEKLVSPSRRRVVRGFGVNLAAVKNMRLEDYGVIEFSTHALIDDEIPEISRIALSQVDRYGRPVDGGYLRPYQLGNLPLDGSVVVLSACDTALGKPMMGEGLLGLTSSLFTAGAAQLVLTLTEVDSEGSAAFLGAAYQHFLARQPVPMERAVREARREMARSARWNDPYYWASFIVMGRPSD